MSHRSPEFVVAVDSGGTATRAGCFALDGRRLSGAEGRGGAHHHDDGAAANLAGTVAAALADGGLDPAGAVAFVAGVSGISRRGSNQGGFTSAAARDFYPLPQLSCPTRFVNDAVVAHRGALTGRAGVVVVAGTGSMVLAVDGADREFESGQFEHYAGGARHLVFEAVHQLLQGRAGATDAELVDRTLAHFDVPDLPSLPARLVALAELDRNDVKRRYGDLAPAVTALADTCPVADRALRRLTDATAAGVLLLAPLTGVWPTPVACTGSLAQDPAFAARLATSLDLPGVSPTQLVPAGLGALGGAALMALQDAGVDVDRQVLARLAG